MALHTTDLISEGTSTGGSKTIEPGNHLLKINSIELEDFSFIPGAYHLKLNVETKPIEGFEGFMIDKDNPSLGHYKGQIGRVKASQYAFANGETKTGIPINRDKSILIFMQNLCKALEINDWFVAQDGLHETIEDFIAAFNKTAPFQDKYLNFCIAGKEYQNKNGYTSYDMWLVKSEKGKYSFGVNRDKVMDFTSDLHLKKMENKPIDSFGSDDDEDDFPTPGRVNNDFSIG